MEKGLKGMVGKECLKHRAVSEEEARVGLRSTGEVSVEWRWVFAAGEL